jgi:hypothetical protein
MKKKVSILEIIKEKQLYRDLRIKSILFNTYINYNNNGMSFAEKLFYS